MTDLGYCTLCFKKNHELETHELLITAQKSPKKIS